MERVGERIRNARESLGWGVSQLAKTMGVSRQTLHKWESGEIVSPRPDQLFKLARKLNRDPEWLITGKEPPRASSEEQHRLLTHFARLDPALRQSILTLICSLPPRE
ncbi:helix-turn-helix domain-containing protein [Endothiovibrio diazotrophicus]